MKITLNLTPKQIEKMVDLLKKGLAYDDEHYSYKVSKTDEDLFTNIINQICNTGYFEYWWGNLKKVKKEKPLSFYLKK